MRKLYKLTAVIAVILLAMTFFCTAVYAEPAEEPTETPVESVTESPEPPEEEFNIGDIPPGVGTVVDVFHDEIGRRFYTIQTPAGNTFYLIIDFTRQNENVYFLDAVNERDLLALAEKGDNAQPGRNISAIPDPNGNTSDPPGNPTDPKPEPTDNGSNFMTLLVVFVVLIGGGAGYYFKIYRKKKDNEIRDEYEDEPDDYAGDDYETEPEDDSPPWEEDEDV